MGWRGKARNLFAIVKRLLLKGQEEERNHVARAGESRHLERGMVEDIRTSLAVVQKAMNIEQTGRAFYLKAAQTTQDKSGQAAFSNLADDEQHHYDLLKKQYESLTNEGQWTSSPEVKTVTIILKQRPFPGSRIEIEKAVKTRSTDSDALLYGMDIEVKSFDMYRETALETTDPSGKQMFEWLAVQESGHFDILMMRYDFLYGPTAWYP